MDFGLSEDEIQQIKFVFLAHSKVQEVILFGSRAMGTYRPGSDIDLVIKGIDITLNDLLSIGIKLDQLGLLLKFDLQDYFSIKDLDIHNHINRVGVLFYKKN